MLTQDDIQRERYESRMKGLMDYRSEMKAERQEGRAEGIAEGIAKGIGRGERIGQIQLLQVLLRETQTPDDDLKTLTEESLEQMRSRLLEAARLAGFPV
ncbi:MAG TPA: hypothetical protein VK137_11250 [Planctomycetaceae bacterium]|nr:hypothetical protein [Planctomycetaceae bacterium]